MHLVRNRTRAETLAQRAGLAATFLARLRGLLGRHGWGELDGLWIEPCSGVHTLGMRFAIDVALLGDDGRVLWAGTIPPWRLGRVHLDASAALELPAGTLARTGTTAGDRLEIFPTAFGSEELGKTEQLG